jgi:hypothetical protein
MTIIASQLARLYVFASHTVSWPQDRPRSQAKDLPPMLTSQGNNQKPKDFCDNAHCMVQSKALQSNILITVLVRIAQNTSAGQGLQGSYAAHACHCCTRPTRSCRKRDASVKKLWCAPCKQWRPNTMTQRQVDAVHTPQCPPYCRRCLYTVCSAALLPLLIYTLLCCQ